MGAQAQDAPHWSVNMYDYQYDMTAYVTLVVDNEVVTDLSGYEIAAFCGTECRGVATVETVTLGGQQKSYAYLRIRSNQEQGETITFKVYEKSKKREFNIENGSMTFKSLDVQGLPSAPVQLALSRVIPGDANGDGEVDLTDASIVFDFYMGEEMSEFFEAAADFDGDGTVDLTDAVLIFEYYMNQ
jgi:hypothetical protein